ncbi:hypothetical protein HYH03_013913 [Edaphochlamys debaryana]|uniref:Uncharacterized protein n=1 Tax=Edaphochlamys debaryana TaxID=47281 RepID=A0A836BU34_9CHLO|nr:hypothetical protein HYH03_013913 [Edaphochlamys debaryana]|eukprot:KAG2487494.1 hypothetical protein HYH03_013913 [Edaphochlamys debaryana]
MASADVDPAPPPDPVAAVWATPALLGCAASFLDPSQAAWSFIRVNKAAAAAFDTHGQLLPRIVSLRWLLGSGLLATPEGRAHARAMCYRLTLKQRVRLLCLSAASGCSLESLGGAVAAAGLSPPPVEVLVTAASAGRLAACRWLVEELGCPGLHRLACLSLLSAAGTAGVAEEALAWLEPGAKEGWSEEQVAAAASGDPRAVDAYMLFGARRAEDRPVLPPQWFEMLLRVAERRDLERIPADQDLSWSPLTVSAEFYLGPHAAQAVARLAQMALGGPELMGGLTSVQVRAAATAGHAEAVRRLLQRGVRLGEFHCADVLAARGGHLGVLQALHEAGCVRDPAGMHLLRRCMREGLEADSLPVASWLVETFGISDLLPTWGLPRLESWLCSLPVAKWLERTVGPALGLSRRSGLYAAAARSGSVVVMEALPVLLGEEPQWGAHAACVWPAAAASGCEAAVDWLAARGVGSPRCGHEYVNAARIGDVSMLLRLRKVGCPYGYLQAAEALAQAASRVPASASASALPWLAEPGRPVSWGEAAVEARAENPTLVARLAAALSSVLVVLVLLVTVAVFFSCVTLLAIGLVPMGVKPFDISPHDCWRRFVLSYVSSCAALLEGIGLFIEAKRHPPT